MSRIFLAGQAGQLEAELNEGESGCGVVLCHPHPLYGGTMDDRVLSVIEAVFRQRKDTTLRFNFRGVGASAGAHDEGQGPVDDVLSAAHFLRDAQDCSSILLAGYSFGACVALRAQSLANPARMLLLAPPVLIMGGCAKPEVPTLVLLGDRDQIVDARQTADWFASGNTEVRTIAGADHAFFAQQDEITRAIEAFMEQAA